MAKKIYWGCVCWFFCVLAVVPGLFFATPSWYDLTTLLTALGAFCIWDYHVTKERARD